MLWKITDSPFAVEEIAENKGQATNIISTFNQYTITENGIYLIPSFYSANAIVEFYKKSATTINIYSSSAIANFHPTTDGDFTETKWGIVKKLAYEMPINSSFATYDNTDYDECYSIFSGREAQRQFMLFNVADIDGDITLNQVFISGTNTKEIIKIV